MILLADITSAFTLLTRLPVSRFGGSPDLGRCVWAFPIVGLAVNGTGALIDWLVRLAHVPALLAAAWTLAVMLVLTGAFHEDGLADTADGFGGGATRARKLEIMHDSRIGSYGVVALLLSLMMRTAAIAALDDARDLILAGMLGRSAMILPLMTLSPARAEGMGASVGSPPMRNAVAGVGLSILAGYALLPLVMASVVVISGFATALVVATLADRQIGGHTGDVLGATEVATECVVLTVLAGALGC
ncbi:MAG TPA: adenosylcobinamide-GDP ribazoletransferase [Rhodopila sp.]